MLETIKKNKIIQICPVLYSGGIQTLLYRKANWLIKKGYNVTLLTTSEGDLHNMFRNIGVDVIICDEIKYGFYNITFTDFLNFVNKVIQNIVQTNDILVIEACDPYTSMYGVILSSLLHVRFVTGVYHPRAYCTGFEKKGQRFKELLIALDKVNALTFMNEKVFESHEKFYNLRFNNHDIIRLPIDTNVSEGKVKTNGFKIVSVGRLVDFKKYVYGLINDFDDFYEINNESSLIIIGDGDEKSRLLKFVKNKRSYRDGKILFLGNLPYSEMESNLRGANMFVGMGTSLLEAANLAIPSIVAPCYTDNNISNGLLYEDIDNLGETKNSCNYNYKYYMLKLSQMNGTEYDNICIKCKKYINDYYSIDVIMNRWLNKIKNINTPNLQIPLDEWISKPLIDIFLTRKYKEYKKIYMNVN